MTSTLDQVIFVKHILKNNVVYIDVNQEGDIFEEK